MRNLKDNTKTKLISLLSAIVLWLYVMTVIDPEETRIYKDIPITIANMQQLKSEDLTIYPEAELFTDISIKGKLSRLKRISKDSIRIYGSVEQPTEGKNLVTLRADLSEGVSYELQPNIITVNLEKNISEVKPVNIKTEGKYVSYIDKVTSEKQSVNVNGPRNLVNEVYEVVGNLNVDTKDKNFSKRLKLIAIDRDGEVVEGVIVEEEYTNVDVVLLEEKTVPIEVNIKDENSNLKEYKLLKTEVKIKGTKEVIKGIQSIYTKPIDVSTITQDSIKDVELDIPPNISVSDKIVPIKFDVNKSLTKEFNISKENIEFRNIEEGQNIENNNLPEVIVISVTYNDEDMITESDIKLYVDLNDKLLGDNEYIIKYENNDKIKEITINPNSVKL